MDKPVFVASIPKAGTYLMAAILGEMGLRDLQRHVYPDAYHDCAQTFYKDGNKGLPTEVRRPIEKFAEDAGPGGLRSARALRPTRAAGAARLQRGIPRA